MSWEWTEGQQKALEEVPEWAKRDFTNKPVYRIFGYAGTGKTTVTKTLLEKTGLKPAYMTYTGKAAMVMRQNGMDAKTIHSAIYKFQPPDGNHFSYLQRKLREAKTDKDKKRIQAQMDDVQKFVFTLNENSYVTETDIIVCDEVSMVNEYIALDMLSFGKPVLVLGDPFQLDPVEGQGFFTDRKPDIMLTEVKRQALENPLIKIATEMREGIFPPYGVWENDGCSTRIIKKRELKPDDMLNADQIICGTNKKRRALNLKMRQLLGYSGTFPQVGEKLICLKNNANKGLFNGLTCWVEDVGENESFAIPVKLSTEMGERVETTMLGAHFEEYEHPGTYKQLTYWDKRDIDEFDFGYCRTVHKSQGSQDNNILFFDDGMFSFDYGKKMRLFYTAFTRAQRNLVVAR